VSAWIWQLARFGVVGLVNTALTFVVYGALVAAGAPAPAAGAVGFGAGAVNGFLLNRGWTFRAGAAGWEAASRYVVVALLGAGLDAAGVAALQDGGAARLAAEALVLPPVSVVTFALCRGWVFREAGGTARLRPALAAAACLALLAGGAWRAGSFAVQYAYSPATEPCPLLAPGSHPLGAGATLQVPRGAFRPLALVLVPSRATDAALSGAAGRRGLLVAYAPATGLARVLDAVQRSACVDPARVYAAGFGRAAATAACSLSGRLAGAAIDVADRRRVRPCDPARPLPVLVLGPRHGASAARRLVAGWRREDACPLPAAVFSPVRGVDELAWRGCAAQTLVEHARLAAGPLAAQRAVAFLASLHRRAPLD
jgi:putative flippase GtrA